MPVEHTPIQGVLTLGVPEIEDFGFEERVIPEV